MSDIVCGVKEGGPGQIGPGRIRIGMNQGHGQKLGLRDTKIFQCALGPLSIGRNCLAHQIPEVAGFAPPALADLGNGNGWCNVIHHVDNSIRPLI